ncbi:hypothetical protein F5B22DRAFT_187378 [Xylaria bambusicola]|uniref:uncharacterized protein n=1 Tax=Xylaria bambusicola TaxID=326684 RepID=UPI0020084EA2|nr:uncharacterized protein F5B22DRAFT_187378 [Xylaria bambusicola]KAI0515382.1 hypothetical protein F5B22DRAFT_187378 [Xylaria bambusicola]
MAPLIPTLAAHARSILSSAAATRTQAVQTASDHLSQIGPLAARAILLARDDDDKDDGKNKDPQAVNPSIGVTDPNNINNVGIFVLFGLIGVAFVVTGIWFFFWAKNGGFYFKQDDWEDYKSTVLRRKGPNGTLLSGATPSTNLGGGSVYKDVDDGSTEYTGGLTQMTGDTGDTMSTLTGITAGPSDIAGRERRRRQREKKEREHEKRRERKKGRRKVGEDGVLIDEEAEEDAKRNLRAYRSERAARVGGLNGQSEGSEWDGSTNPEMSTVSGAESLLYNRQSTPTSTPTKDKDSREKRRSSRREKEKQRENHDAAPSETTYDNSTQASKNNTTTRKAGGIRKVYSTADRTNMREQERLRAEARRLAEKGRAAAASTVSSSSSYQYQPSSHRRDFSYQRADLRNPGSAIAEEAETNSLMMGHENNNNNNNNNTTGGRYLPAPSSWNPPPQESDIADYANTEDLGTKSYRCYIPGLSSEAAATESLVSGSSSEQQQQQHVDSDRRERRKRRDAQRSRRE